MLTFCIVLVPVVCPNRKEEKLQHLVKARVNVWCENALFLLQDFDIVTSTSGHSNTNTLASPKFGKETVTILESPQLKQQNTSVTADLKKDTSYEDKDEPLVLSRSTSTG